jgi:hypothetical protein
MNLQRLLLTMLVILDMSLLIVHPGFSQVKGEEIKSFSGYIDNIPKDSKFIVVNERRVFISSNTRIIGENGNILKIDELKPGLSVAVEGFWKPNGIFAEKITVIKTSKIKR